MQEKQLHIIWFKRDLRLSDHRGIYNALKSGHKILFLYIQDEGLLNAPQYSERHWTFIKQSLLDMNAVLDPLSTQVMACRGSALSIFKRLSRQYKIREVHHYEELGIEYVYRRDQQLRRYFKNNGINLSTYVRNGLKNWSSHMETEILNYELNAEAFVNKSKIDALYLQFPPMNLFYNSNDLFQVGGSRAAMETLLNYQGGESRLSPYISWGNLSVKQVYKYAKTNGYSELINHLRKQNLIMNDYRVRQKLAEPKLNESISSNFKGAWENAATGFPLIDASLKCLEQTGFLPYKFRIYLVNFYTQYLLQPWQDVAVFLSQRFLDFHPAIHYPQLINTKEYVQSAEVLDPQGEFIKNWIKALRNVPTKNIFKPYLMTTLEQQKYQLKIGKDYPKPINALHYDL